MKEIWKPIDNYENLYEVSNFGRVKSYHYHNGTYSRILKPRKVKDGYLMIALYKDKKCKNFQVHQLVANAFIPNIKRYTEVNHKNFDKTDNNVTNLEWITRRENVLHYFRNVNKERRLA